MISAVLQKKENIRSYFALMFLVLMTLNFYRRLLLLKDEKAKTKHLWPSEGHGWFQGFNEEKWTKGVEMTKAAASKHDPPKFCPCISPLGSKQWKSCSPLSCFKRKMSVWRASYWCVLMRDSHRHYHPPPKSEMPIQHLYSGQLSLSASK